MLSNFSLKQIRNSNILFYFYFQCNEKPAEIAISDESLERKLFTFGWIFATGARQQSS
jgi:hypothetical protein